MPLFVRKALVLFGAVTMVGAPAAAMQSTLPSIEPFLMDRAEEIALARSAGPHAVGKNASVMVLTQSGYEQAAEGSNGFVCFVGRGWSGPVVSVRGGKKVVRPDAFNPKLRAPHCFNAPAARSILPWHELMTRALLSGEAAEDLEETTALAVQAGKLSIPEPGAMAYMASPHQFLGDFVKSWRPHLMLYLPYSNDALVGARQGIDHEFPFVVEEGTTWSVVIVPIGRFSDESRPTWEPPTGS